MLSKKLISYALIIASLGVLLFASGCVIRARPMVPTASVVYTAPPPPPANRVVVSARPAAPYTGAVWVDGHHQWRGNRYVWVPGRWIRPRAGYVYTQPRWVRRGNGWVYQQGNWRRGPRRARPAVRVQSPRPPAGGVQVQVR